MLLACGLRRHEIAQLTVDHLRQRQEHWAIVDLVGNGGHIRTVPVLDWAYQRLKGLDESSRFSNRKLFRKVSSAGKCWGDRVTEKLVVHVVKEFAARIGNDRLAPHDRAPP